MSATIYDKAYFIAKFEAIPEEKWCVGELSLGDQNCAFGLCHPDLGARSKEGEALASLMPNMFAGINDGRNPNFQQPTPKQRILAALRSLP